MIYTMEEMLEHYVVYRKEVVQKCCIHPDGDAIYFPERDYWIPFDSINSYSNIVRWVMHMTEKNWIDISMIREMIYLACSRHGIDSFSMPPIPLKSLEHWSKDGHDTNS